jgi:hypothetical protein
LRLRHFPASFAPATEADDMMACDGCDEPIMHGWKLFPGQGGKQICLCPFCKDWYPDFEEAD